MNRSANRSVSVHQFAMIPRADIPRSKFRIETTHKTTFDSGYLIPVYLDEVLPGDTFSLSMTALCRLGTPIVPLMDNLYLESFFFFVPNRLVWDNWQRFCGEQDPNPGSSTSYVIPQLAGPSGGFAPNQLGDYFGLPTVGQYTPATALAVNALPFRGYNLIYNEWFRDENLQNSTTVLRTDGPDPNANYALKRRGKRHDYFTSALPFVQKGASVLLPLGTSAPIKTSTTQQVTGLQEPLWMANANDGSMAAINRAYGVGATAGKSSATTTVTVAAGTGIYPANLYADLSAATAATINQIRQSFQIQKLLERDARGGTRYTELIRSHFGVISPDARLDRPEYLGGGTAAINIHPLAQTSGTAASGTTTPLGYLSGIGTLQAHGHGFTSSFTEHGYVFGLISVRADLSYQQGIRKLWSRSTRYDFYWPVFAMLGEQAVLNKEIYSVDVAGVQDNAVFGYQERWAEYRYNPSLITGLFKSTSAGTLDFWHMSQKFTALPVLNDTFISDTPPLDRVLATTPSTGKQLLIDMLFQVRAARPMPMYSVPGLVDHF